MKGSQCANFSPVSQDDTYLQKLRPCYLLGFAACFTVWQLMCFRATKPWLRIENYSFPILLRRRYAGGQACVQPDQKQWVIHSCAIQRAQMNALGFSPLTHSPTPMRHHTDSSQCSEAPFKSQQRGNCWCSRLDLWSLLGLWSDAGSLTVDLKVLNCVCMLNQAALHCCWSSCPSSESQNNQSELWICNRHNPGFQHCNGLLMYLQLYWHNLVSLVGWCQQQGCKRIFPDIARTFTPAVWCDKTCARSHYLWFSHTSHVPCSALSPSKWFSVKQCVTDCEKEWAFSSWIHLCLPLTVGQSKLIFWGAFSSIFQQRNTINVGWKQARLQW